jgi:hypothetical protein
MADDAEQLVGQLERLSTDELVSILRNRDDEEWQPQVFEVVASILTSRGLSPKDVDAMGPEGSAFLEAASNVTVATFFSPAEAHASRMALEEAGLSAWVVDEAVGTMYGFGVGTRLQVRATDETVAREILASPPAPSESLPLELSDPACPACGSRNVAPEAWVDEERRNRPPWRGRRKWHYVCADCDEAWPLEGAAQQ